MNEKRFGNLGNNLSKRLRRRAFGTMIFYTLGLLALFIFAYITFDLITWQDGILYRLLRRIIGNKFYFTLMCLLVGYVFIFMHYWKMACSYVDVLVEASSHLISDSNDLIRLPEELVEVEATLNEFKQDSVRNAIIAREAEQRKNDLIVYLAHDLKTPLTSVIGYLTLLRDENQISDELRQKYLGISLDKAERLEELINEFFEITRFNLSELSLDPSRVNLSRMLEQMAYEFEPVFKTKNIKYHLEMEKDLEIRCDVPKMERVFDNLFRNAVNYSFENAEVTVKASRIGNGVVMNFINQGNTIPQEKLGRIFEQFFRLDSSRGSGSGGAGLGLAISKEIIEAHRGTIKASSADEIINFEIYLPLYL